MNRRDEALFAILRIGHESTMRGEGLSLNQALIRTNYLEERKQFDAQDLVPLIHAHRELIEQWVKYSEDKWTSGGWYLSEAGRIGQSCNDTLQQFDGIEQAVAEYVVRELDFLADADSRRQSRYSSDG